MLWVETATVDHVDHSDFQVLVNLYVHLHHLIEGVLLLLFSLAFVVSEHVLEEALLQILVHELRYVHWQHTKLVFVLLNQLSMFRRQEIIHVLFPCHLSIRLVQLRAPFYLFRPEVRQST